MAKPRVIVYNKGVQQLMVANFYQDRDEGQVPISLHHIVTIIFKHKWIILSFFFGIVGVVLLGSLGSNEVFEARLKCVIEKQAENPLLTSSAKTLNDKYDWIASEIEILKSDSVAYKVIEDVGLNKIIPILAEEIITVPDSIKKRTVQILQQKMKVEVGKNSNIVDISYRDQNAVVAARIVNSILDKYKERRSEMYNQSGREKDLKESMERVQTKIQDLERAQLEYKRKHNMISPEAVKNNLLTRLTNTENQLEEVEREKWRKTAVLEALKKQISKGEGIATSAIESAESPFRSSLVASWRAELADLELKREMALQKYTPEYEDIKNTDILIKVLKTKIDNEMKILLEWQETNVRSLAAREYKLRRAMEQMRDETRALAQIDYDFSQLSRGLAENREIYSQLRTEYEETGMLRANYTGVNVRVITPAAVPSDPVNPRTKLKLAIAVILGLVCGLGLAFFREYFDHTFTFPDELERYAGLSILGSIREFDERLVYSHNGDQDRYITSQNKYQIDRVSNLRTT